MDENFNGGITILVKEDEVNIELYDDISNTRFVRINLTPEQFCKALSRHYNVRCNIETIHLERVGKKMLMDTLEFPMPEYTYENRKEIATRVANEVCPEGWIPDNYFCSKESFFTKDGQEYARTTIRRWE